MSTIKTQHPKYTPGILSVLPLFYVGWSDSVLSPTEMKIIHEKIKGMDFLKKEEKEMLLRWADPASPPDEHTFAEWINVLKKYSKKIEKEKKQSLVDLGLEIAAVSGQVSPEEWFSVKTKNALRELESALGVGGAVSANLLLAKLHGGFPAVVAGGKCSFSVGRLRDYLDGRFGETKNRMRVLLCDPFFAQQIIPDKDRYRRRVLSQVEALARQGVSAYSFPKKYGGGERRGDHIAVFEMLALGDLSLTIKFGVQFGLFGGALYQLGTEQHHRQYLEAMHRAELPGCFAMTETGHGSNVKALRTTATFDRERGEIVVHSPDREAGKEFIGNALHCRMAVVFAQLVVGGRSHGVHAVLVPVRDESGRLLKGITVEDNGYKMGLNGVDNGRIWFDHVRVPVANLLNRFGGINEKGEYESPIKNPSRRFFTMLGTLVAGRISVGLAGISASKKALTIAVRYALRRRQFGPKDGEAEMLIMDYPTHQHRLIPLLAKTYAYHFALRKLANKYTDKTDGDLRHIETLAAGLKSKASWHATRTIQECREACGGKGYLRENRLPDLKADTDIFTTFEGDNTVLMQLVAKGVLSRFRQSFHDEGFRAVVRYVLTRFGNTMQELNPVQTRNTSMAHLTGTAFYRDAFNYRFQKVLISLSTRMRDYLKKRMDPFQAFLRCQVHLMALAHAYIDNIVLKSFLEAIEECEDGALRAILSKVCGVYALTIIQEEKGWFLENDYLSGSKAKAIRRVHNKLVLELRPEVEGLVAAFGIPDALLSAQIV